MSAKPLNQNEFLFPVNPIGELFIAYFHGRKVPTTFTNYLVIPTKDQFEAFFEELRSFYDDYSDDEIGVINREAERRWHEETYGSDKSQQKEKPVRKPTPGYVYLARAESGHYKIGLTSNPELRSKAFGLQLPFKVDYVCLIQTEDMKSLEGELHARFASKHVNGEWFNLDAEDVEYIKGLAK